MIYRRFILKAMMAALFSGCESRSRSGKLNSRESKAAPIGGEQVQKLLPVDEMRVAMHSLNENHEEIIFELTEMQAQETRNSLKKHSFSGRMLRGEGLEKVLGEKMRITIKVIELDCYVWEDHEWVIKSWLTRTADDRLLLYIRRLKTGASSTGVSPSSTGGSP